MSKKSGRIKAKNFKHPSPSIDVLLLRDLDFRKLLSHNLALVSSWRKSTATDGSLFVDKEIGVEMTLSYMWNRKAMKWKKHFNRQRLFKSY